MIGYSSAIKGNKLHATTWMNLKIIISCEKKSQIIYYIISFVGHPRTGKLIMII